MPIAARLLLLLALAGCAIPGNDDGIDFDTCGVRPRVELPVEIRGNVPLVHATIKGLPATFILDTGATGVVLTEPALRRLDLKLDARQVVTSRGVGGETRFFAGRISDFEIGGMKVPDHQISVLPPTAFMASGNLIDGLFGVSILSVFEIDLDLPKRRVTLYAGRLCPETVIPPWTAPYATIDASRSEKGRFIIPVRLDGQMLTALLDTGAATTVLAADVARRLGVSDADLESGPRATLVGVGPNAPAAHAHRFAEIRIGDDTFANPVLLVTERPSPNIDMILGTDYLLGRRLWLSYARQRVFIERQSH